MVHRTHAHSGIFARRAVTREGKLQTELALLRYCNAARLAGPGQPSRPGRRRGGGAGARRGAGESKLEYDPPPWRRRIEAF